ncbi:MAG TPA: MFS transporter [Kribbella sp.]|nr:MFS transporter [Kribbella sp.]
MTSTASAATQVAARRAAVGTYAAFASNGLLYASWATRIPDVRDRLGVGPAVLGLALLSMAAGSLLSMPLTGWACRRWGSRTITTICAVVASPALIGAAFAPNALTLALVLFGMGLFWGAWDVSMNVQGHHVERALGRALMPRFHALWSLGGIVGAGIGSGLAAIRLPVWVHFVLAAAVAVALGLWSTARFLPDREDLPAESVAEQEHRPAWQVLDLRLILIGVMVLCSTVGEGAAADWLALFLRDERAASPGLAAAGFTAFTIAMTVGRLLGTTAIERLGRGITLRLAGVLTVAGVAVTLTVPWTGAAFVGAALWGLGLSTVFPGGISAAGDGARRPADAIAAVSTIGYAGFILGPPAIGLVAQHTSLSVGLWFVALMGAGITVFAGAAKPGVVLPQNPVVLGERGG